MSDLPILTLLEGLGKELMAGSWVHLALGFLLGYALARVVRVVVPPLAFLYALAWAMGRADPGALVALLEDLGRGAWGLLSGTPVASPWGFLGASFRGCRTDERAHPGWL